MANRAEIELAIERVLQDIEALNAEEKRYQALYTQAYKDMFLWFGKKKVDKYVALANQAQYEKQRKYDELHELRLKLSRAIDK